MDRKIGNVRITDMSPNDDRYIKLSDMSKDILLRLSTVYPDAVFAISGVNADGVCTDVSIYGGPEYGDDYYTLSLDGVVTDYYKKCGYVFKNDWEDGCMFSAFGGSVEYAQYGNEYIAVCNGEFCVAKCEV